MTKFLNQKRYTADQMLKRLDFSLFSNKNLSEILSSCSWAHGHVTWAKMA